MNAPRFVLCLGFLGALAAGCGVSPQPSPPDAILDGDRIGLTPGVELVASVTGFAAEPGTVSPPRGKVLITNLDGSDAPSTTDVQPDGSFTIAVPGVAGQTYRFQVKDGDTRSQPYDLVVSSSGTTATNVELAPTCLVAKPARWAKLDGPGDALSIVLHNQCDTPVAIATPRLRRGLAGFSFSPTKPLDVAPGELATLTVHAGGAGETEDVLLLDVTAPAASRRAITLTIPDP